MSNEELDFMTNIVVSSFKDQTVPKKKYRKRKENSVVYSNDAISREFGAQFSVTNTCESTQTFEEHDEIPIVHQSRIKREMEFIQSQICEIAFFTYKNEEIIRNLKLKYERTIEINPKKII